MRNLTAGYRVRALPNSVTNGDFRSGREHGQEPTHFFHCGQEKFVEEVRGMMRKLGDLRSNPARGADTGEIRVSARHLRHVSLHADVENCR